MNSKIKYGEGLKLLMQKVHPDLQLTERASSFLENIFNNVNDVFVGECLRISRDDPELKLVTLARVVEEQLEGNTRHHAQAEGNKAVFKYNAGILHFKPKTAAWISKEEPRHVKKQLRSIFSTGVTALCSLFQDASLTAAAMDVMCELLGNLVETISNNAKLDSENIGENDVARAVKNVIPGQMWNHALAEGTKLAVLAESLEPYVKKKPILPDKKKKTKQPILVDGDRPIKKRRVSEKVVKTAPRVSRRKPPREKSVRKRREREKEVAIPATEHVSERKSPRKQQLARRRVSKTVYKATPKRVSGRKSPRKPPVSKHRVSRKVDKAVLKRRKSPRKKLVKRRRVSRKVSETAQKRVSRKKSSRKTFIRKHPASKKVVKILPKGISERKPTRKLPVTKEVAKPAAKRVRREKSRRRQPSKKRPVSRKAAKVSPERTRRIKSVRSVKRHRVSKECVTPAPKRISGRKFDRKQYPKRRRVSKRVSKTKAPRKAPKTVTERKSTKKRRISQRTIAKTASKQIRTKKPKVVKRRTEGIKFAFLEIAVKSLSSLFNQTLSSDALRIICNYLANLVMMVVVAIDKKKYLIIGPKEIRYAVQKVFPKELQESAKARLSQVAARIPNYYR